MVARAPHPIVHRSRTMPRPHSSGDLLADRRYAYAEALLGEGDAAGAAELAEQALERAPDYAPGWFLLGLARARLFEAAGAAQDREAAIAAFEKALAADPEDVLGAQLRLVAFAIGEPGAAMVPGYVRALFDDYAPRFERHLVETLGYRGPQMLLDALDGLADLPPRFGAAIDLGCGSGLMGRLLRQRADRLIGIDISPKMIALAGRIGIYDRLVEGDAAAALATEPEASADLVVAADVLIYIGALDPFMAAIARVLRPGGHAALTAQSHEREGVALGPDGRLVHADAFLRGAIERAGLEIRTMVPAEIRKERGQGVPGRVVTMRKP